MAASRRGQPELHVRLPSIPSIATLPDLPPISALFLIDFDVKAGYTISWKASNPGIELEGTVEYKSLPSGLHTVSEDLIYFVHDGYAGLSAFVNAPVEDTAARNARMLAVGVLVPLSYGRLGRAWRHAEGLKVMASALAANSKDTGILEQYWEKNQARDPVKEDSGALKEALESPSMSFQTPPKPPRGHTRNRSASDGAALIPPGHKLSPFHPAWSLTKLLDTFGPLIFPIQRAALLRKRILISGHAPVQEACNFVYDISILSNIPLSTFDLLSPNSPPHRLRPLFSIGVHDIPFLVDDAKSARNVEDSPDYEGEMGTGWIACTTDSILSKKDTLWDMLITMPSPHSSNTKKHVWPTVECPHGVSVKATQRDLRRFRSLKAGLARFGATAGSGATSPTTPRALKPQHSGDRYIDDAEQIIEPLSWTALAYNGFMWWASAGEQARSNEAEEAAHDSSLLAELSSPSMNMSMPRSADISASVTSLTVRRNSAPASAPLDSEEARVELAIIAYFHRLTTQILGTLVDLVESASDSDAGDESPMGEDDALIESNDDDRGRGVRIESDAMANMGLDVWSASDAYFVKEALTTYFDQKAFVEGKGVEVCGVRVC
ncbi:Uu.00g061180.m01.CDS01 [Anthostomella pinea]|uniref:Uu.00g061180.m01.CDS01 n=1 Tax=Anthostomella pinea TaxID=933095 RepID=A0AAI8YME3_9PEZI|nr:Uu.00g061180.m01.CDS01 [Anthostomella pinea]